MAHMTYPADIELKHEIEDEVRRALGPEAWSFLTRDLQRLAIDATLVQRVFESTEYNHGMSDEEGAITHSLRQIFGDYSFVLAPAYKLFEGFVYLIALTTGVITPQELKTKYLPVGRLTNIEHPNNDELKKIIEAVATRIKDREIITRWQALYDTYEDFRNSPAHYGESIEAFEQIDTDISHIFTVVRNTTKYLIRSGVLRSMQNHMFDSVHQIPDEVIKI